MEAAIAAEEECKEADVSDPHFGGPAPQPHPTHLDDTFSYHGYATSTPMMDGHLLARPLVLDEVQPATLRASTSMSRQTTPSVMRPNDRCPPAASPRSSTLLQRSVVWLGARVHRLNHDLSSSRSQSPSHSRPPAALRTRVPPVSAHVGYITVQGAGGASLRKPIADANGDSPGKRGHWKVVGGPGRRPHTYPPHPGHPLAPEGKTRSRMQRTRSRIQRTRSRIQRTRSRTPRTRSCNCPHLPRCPSAPGPPVERHPHLLRCPTVTGPPAEASDSHTTLACEDVRRILVDGRCCVGGSWITCIPGELVSLTQPGVSNRDQGIPGGSTQKSEWSRPDAIRRHHNPEDADKHTKTIMSPNILSSVGLHWNSDREISQEFLMRDSAREISSTKVVRVSNELPDSDVRYLRQYFPGP